MSIGIVELKEQLEKCTRCAKAEVKEFALKYLREVPKPLKVMFLAQEPPKEGFFYNEEDGRTGGLKHRLFKLLQKAGFPDVDSIETFTKRGMYLTDAAKCRGGDYKQCRSFLLKEIELLQPRVIVILGRKPMKAVRGICYQMLQTYFPTTAPIKDDVRVRHLKVLHRYM